MFVPSVVVPVFAVELSSLAEYEIAPVLLGSSYTAQDPKQATAGTILSMVDFGFQLEGDASGRAYASASDGGVLAAFADTGGSSGGQGWFAATASWADRIFNDMGGDRSYQFRFSIPQIELQILGNPGSSVDYSDCVVFCLPPEVTHAGYEVDITLDGVPLWYSGAVLTYDTVSAVGGPYRTRVLGVNGLWGEWALSTRGVELDVAVENDPDDGLKSLLLGPYEAVLDLGTLGEGESFLLEYVVNVMAATSYFESFASSRFGDPFAVTDSGLRGRITSAVGEPWTPGLFLTGLFLMLVANRTAGVRCGVPLVRGLRSSCGLSSAESCPKIFRVYYK